MSLYGKARSPEEKHRFISQTIFYLFCFLFFYVSCIPFYYLRPLSLEQITFSIPKYLPFFVSILLIGVIGVDREKTHRVIFFKFDFWLGVYLVLCMLSLLNAPNPVIGFGKLLYFSCTGILLCFIVRVLEKDDLRKLLYFLMFLATSVSLYGIATFWIGEDFLWGEVYSRAQYHSGSSRVSSTIGNPIMLGGYLTLVVPFTLSFAVLHTKLRGRLFFLLSFSLILVCALLTFSRSAWLSMLVAIGMWIGKFWRHFSWWKNSFGTLLIVLLLAPVVQVFMGDMIEEIGYLVDRRLEESLKQDRSIEYRLAQFKTTYDIVREYPLLGTGFGNFTRLFEKSRDENPPIASLPNAAHTTDNMYLMLIAETGPLSCLVVVFFFASFLIMIGRQKPAQLETERTLLSWAVICCVCAFAVNIFFWDGLNQPAIRIVFWSLIGIGCKIGPKANGENGIITK
jgi:putative inorganic carbon (hco3(-)) transporter